MAHVGRGRADDALLVALACGATVENAAKAAGVGQSTVYRRLNEADFRERLSAVRSDMVRRTAGALTAASGQAVQTLLELQRPGVQDAVRLGAAKAVLEIGVRLRELAELADQLDAMRRRLDALQQARDGHTPPPPDGRGGVD